MSNYNDIPLAPPPWQLDGEVFMFLGWSWTPRLPPGSFNPAEQEAILASDCSRLVRTPYAMQLYRYKTSPVGPYDELMFIPGWFDTEVRDAQGKTRTIQAPRITRIYVSTEATCVRGRQNWNVPKHLADFSFTYSSEGHIDVEVFERGGSRERPFFAAKVTPFKRTPAFPFSTSWLPISLDILQPPLPHVGEEGSATVETKDWQHVPLNVRMRGTKLASIAPRLDRGDGSLGYANGVAFPDIAPFSTGVYSADATIDFGVPSQPDVVSPKED